MIVPESTYPTHMQFVYRKIYVYSRMVESAPVENNHGCNGCHTTSNTPKSSCDLCACNFFSGTINGFCSRSLMRKFKSKNKQNKLINIDSRDRHVDHSVVIHTCKPCHVTQSPTNHHWPMQTTDNANDRPHCVRHSCAIESFGMAWWTNPNRTIASFCRMWTQANCRPSDEWPCPISICCWWSISSAALASPNRICECSFGSVKE